MLYKELPYISKFAKSIRTINGFLKADGTDHVNQVSDLMALATTNKSLELIHYPLPNFLQDL